MQLRSDRIPYLYDTQENNRSELQRLDSERKEEFMRMLKGFVASQVLFQPLSFHLGYLLQQILYPIPYFKLHSANSIKQCHLQSAFSSLPPSSILNFTLQTVSNNVIYSSVSHILHYLLETVLGLVWEP
jgi:hypothetical protein